jgi:7,8-dihydropterin-6-yl-methyl-4-(beta-D-ribofuranosyl)aminobenzene 5'-phosphate synthase
MCEGGAPGPVTAVPAEVEAFRGQRIPLAQVERVSMTTLVDNSCDWLAADDGPAHRHPPEAWPRVANRVHEQGEALDGPVAEHGFSALVEVELAGGAVHHVLFDTWISPDGMVTNMRRLGVALDSVEVVVCSHGHFDHTTGLDGFARAHGGRAKLPVVIHPEFWSQRRFVFSGHEPYVLPTPSRSALEGAGFTIVEESKPSFLFESSVLITAEVARTTDFERGMIVHQARRGDTWEPDPLVLDDQPIVLHLRGRGLVVLSGCGHAGIVNIVNIVRYARALTGVQDVHAVVEGFHLTGAIFEPLIAPTANALAELAPDVVLPAHCTGWQAMHALANRLPKAVTQNGVGTRLELIAA